MSTLTVSLFQYPAQTTSESAMQDLSPLIKKK